ncbi:MAG: ApeA N-terminal domain 1-containing protein [Acidimicrobiales bacterium]
MEPFSISGRWWLPSEPDRQVGGTLTFGHGNEGIKLTLLAELTVVDRNAPVKLPLRHEIVFGETTEGRAITLRDTWSSGARRSIRLDGEHVLDETLSAMELFIGAHLVAGEETPVTTVIASFELLADWAWPTVFAREPFDEWNEEKIVVAFETPKPIEFKAFGGDARIAAGFRSSGKTIHDRTFERPVSLVVEFPEPRPYNEIFDAVVKPFQYFLTLVCGAPTQLLQLSFHTPEATHQAESTTIYDTIETAHFGWRSPTSQGGHPHPWEFPLPLARIANRMTAVMAKWSEILEHAASALDVFFSISLGPSHYQETRFLFAAQALEAYHRACPWFKTRRWSKSEFRQRRDTVLDDVQDEQLRSWVEERLRFANEPTLRDRLTELVNHGADAATRLCWPTDAFIATTVDTRHHFTHHEPGSEKKAAKGRDLALLTEQAIALMEVCLFIDLGIPADEVFDVTKETRRARMILQAGSLG